NLHGHGHPKITSAIKAQLDRIAHSSFLGLSNAPAIQLAEKLVSVAQTTLDAPVRDVVPSQRDSRPRSLLRPSLSLRSGSLLCEAAPQGEARVAEQATLSRVFYSDDGSTAMEVAIKMAL